MMQGSSNNNIGYISNPILKATTQQQSSANCARCLEEYEQQNDAIQFCKDCEHPLCDAHVELHQKIEETEDHSLVPIDQLPKHQQHDSLEHKRIDNIKEESTDISSNEQSLSNVLQKHTCFVCDNQLSKHAETTNGDGLLFCSEQCLEHYNSNNRYQSLDLSLIPEEIIDHIMMSLIDVKVLHYLKCADSKWKRKIDEYFEKYVSMFKFKANFGSTGSDNGQFDNPYFVTADRRGNIYVSDCDNNRIQIFDSNGQWKQCIGSYGSENGLFKSIMGIAFNSKNHMLVADFGNDRVQIFDENMQFIKAFGSVGNKNGHFQYPRGITVDADDNIIVTDYWNHRIQIFDEDGKWKQTIGKQGSDNGQFNQPWDVSVCKADGRIFANDFYDHRIQVFSSEGKFLFTFGSRGSGNGQFPYTRGLALSNCGQYLLVCNNWNHCIHVFNAMNGSFVKSYGSKGSGNGHFQHPSGIYISPSGQIIVSEAETFGNQHRVQIFE